MDLSFTIAAGPHQHSHSRVRVPRDSWSNFTVSASILLQPGGPGARIYIHQEQWGPVIPPRHCVPFSSPPTTRRATMEVFEPASTRALILAAWDRRCIASGGPTKTPLATPLLLLREVTAYVLTQSLLTNGCTRHVSWHLLYCCVRALPSNGWFSASTILALSKYATICNLLPFVYFLKNRLMTACLGRNRL
jgi:hypothetical protein